MKTGAGNYKVKMYQKGVWTVWAKKEEDLKILVLSRPKINDRYSDDIYERDYIKKMSLRDTQSWFRMRSP